MIVTERLDLVPATLTTVRAALVGASPLGANLRATMPVSWPPMYLDAPALEFTVARLQEHPEEAEWWLHFVLLRHDDGTRLVVGTAGFTGPPSADGTVEVGYSIVEEHHRRGYATEAVRGMVRHAFAIPVVSRVIAETLPELEPSIGVLRKSSFRLTGVGSGPGIIRFELTRETFESTGGWPAGRTGTHP